MSKAEYRHTDQYRESVPAGSYGRGSWIGQAVIPLLIAFFVLLLLLMIGAWMAMNYYQYMWEHNPRAVLAFDVVVVAIVVAIVGWSVYTKVVTFELHKQERLAGIEALRGTSLAQRINSERYGFNAEYVRGELAIRSTDPKTGAVNNNEYNIREDDEEDDEEQELLPPPRFPEPRDFAAVLETFRPTPENIFLLDTSLGPFTGPMDSIGHVALASPTGGGKTTTARMLVSQVLACGGEVYMANPNFAPVKLNGNRLEDWRPIAANLKEPPAREIGEIFALFDRFIKLVDERRKKEQLTPKRGKDIYLLIGEWPAILAQAYAIGKKEGDTVLAHLGRLLRESRQYGVHVISEFQDALVKTIGGGKGLRDNYRTAYYFGGDDTTAKALLALPNGVSVDDTGLGKLGGAMFRFQSNAAIDGRVPFFSNRALYMLLGFPQDPVHDNVVTGFDDVPDYFLPFEERRSDKPFTEPYSGFHGVSPFSPDDEDTAEIAVDEDYLRMPESAVNEDVKPCESIPNFSPDDEMQIIEIARLQFILDGKVTRAKIPMAMKPPRNNKFYPVVKYICDREGF